MYLQLVWSQAGKRQHIETREHGQYCCCSGVPGPPSSAVGGDISSTSALHNLLSVPLTYMAHSLLCMP